MLTLSVPPEKAVLLIQERIDALETIPQTPSGPEYYDVVRWCSKTWAVIDGIYAPHDPHREEIRSISLGNCSCNVQVQGLLLIDAYSSRLQDYIREIRETTPL